MAKIIAVCKSDRKGIRKEDVREGFFREGYGMEGDAHADCGINRQVSLMAMESIGRMRREGYPVKPGDFAENLTTEGMDLVSLPIGTQLAVGKEVVLQVTQIGKECHSGCAIFHEVGKCIMPKEGVFTRVIKEGRIKTGDEIKVADG
ncbi:MAG: MOSC domain-containing protein [Chloroflexota bacterium]